MSDTLNKDLFEAMIKQAVIQNNKNEIAALPSEEELSKIYTFSDQHNKKMQKLFSADKKREVFSVVIRWSKVAVIAVCACMALTFGALLTSAEVRNAIGDVIITWFEKFTKFQSEELSGEFAEREWKPEYLPEGFVLQDIIEAGEIKIIEYRNSADKIIDFNYAPSDFSTSVDNEDMEYSVFIKNDITYHLFQSSEDSIIVWDMDKYRFTITGNIEIDELLKIALSVK